MSVLPILTHTDQACAIEGRSMNDQLIYIQDMMNFLKHKRGKGMIVGLDLQAAFDKIDPRVARVIKSRTAASS